MVKLMLLAGAGGFIGSAARYSMQVLYYKLFPSASISMFPVVTLLINIAGSLVIGIIYGLSDNGKLASEEIRIFLATGICGGFTTFSAFSLESITLLKSGETLYFIIYVCASVILSIAAAYAGVKIIK
jgi:CrcB protein